jgi:hypothetical protein
MAFFSLSISILQKPALLVPALYKFDDRVPCLISYTRNFFCNVAIVKHDSVDKAPLNDEALSRQQMFYNGSRFTSYKVYLLSCL